MALFFEQGSVKKIALEKKAEAVVLPSFKRGEVGATFLSFGDDYKIINVIVGETYRDIVTCYENAIATIEEQQIRSIVFPVLGAEDESLRFVALWTTAMVMLSQIINEDVDVFLAIDTNADRRLSIAYPVTVFSSDSGNRSFSSGSSMPANGIAMVTQRGYVPDDLYYDVEGLNETNAIAVADAFDAFKEGKKYKGKTISKIVYMVEGFLSSGTVYNILGRNDTSIQVSKDTIVVIAKAMGLSLDELETILNAGGMCLTNTIKEDRVIKEAFTKEYDVYKMDVQMYRNHLEPYISRNKKKKKNADSAQAIEKFKEEVKAWGDNEEDWE